MVLCCFMQLLVITSIYNLTIHIPAWEADSSSVMQNIYLILWNPRFQPFIHNTTPAKNVSSYATCNKKFYKDFSKFYYNAVPYCHLQLGSQWHLSFTLTNQNFCAPFIYHVPSTCLAHLTLLDSIEVIILGVQEEYKFCNFSSCNIPLSPAAVSSLRTTYFPQIY